MLSAARFFPAISTAFCVPGANTGAVTLSDTAREFDTVNGVKARGGALNGPGPAIAAGHVYVNSGYGMWNVWMPGNALIAQALSK